MSTEIYYFSATGNSLAVARDIALKINGKLISIPSVIDKESIKTGADIIGIIFPAYYASLGGSGIPLIVAKFTRKLNDIGSKYIFAICTHSGKPVVSIENLSWIIKSRGGNLAAGFTVKLGFPYSGIQKINHLLFHKELITDLSIDNEKRQKLFITWKEKLKVIHQCVAARKTCKFETSSRVARFVLAPYLAMQRQMALTRYKKLSKSSHMSFEELIPLVDRNFQCKEECNGCGICARVCPVGNIEMIDKKPVWQHHCESCYACFQWCPKDAIHGDIVEYEKRYHHPDVKLSDMLMR